MLEINKPTVGLKSGFTVLTISLSTLQSCQADLVKDNGHKYFLSVLADPYMLVSNECKTMNVFFVLPKNDIKIIVQAIYLLYIAY